MKKSMKVFVALALLLSATLNANAQFSKKGGNRTPDRFHMGIRGGASCNFYNGDADSKGFIFPTGGIALDFQVAPIPIFIGTGLNYVNYGLKEDFRYNGYKMTGKSDAHSIQMPVTVSYHINLAPNLFFNPFLGEFVAYNFNNDFNKQFNYGVRIGCGLNFGRLTFDVCYDLGLGNLGNDRAKMHTETLFMTIGFNWAGRR